jgi:alpha-tubulin suppressor-like RCC1 family protein
MSSEYNCPSTPSPEQKRIRSAHDDGEWMVVAVAAGAAHSMVVTTSGSVYTWGAGDDGVIGHGNEDEAFVPTKIKSFGGRCQCHAPSQCQHQPAQPPAPPRASDLARDSLPSLARSSLPSWSSAPSWRPTCQICTPVVAVDVAAGEGHSLVLADDGRVFSFGYGGHGRLGRGGSTGGAGGQHQLTPRLVAIAGQ